MKRKVNRVGQNTLTVSLPAKWVKQHGIKAGDDIDLSEIGTAITISKSGSSTNKEIEIRLEDGSERYIRSHIGRAYRSGCSKMIVYYNKPEYLVHVKNSVNNMIGADIIDTYANKCVIVIFPVEELDVEFDASIVKMYMTLKTVFETLRQDFKNKSMSNKDLIEELRYNNWKIKDFLLRSAALQCIDYGTYSDLCHITFCLEKISSKFMGFYKRYLMVKKILYNKRLDDALGNIIYILSWFIEKASKGEKFSFKEESRFRHEMLDFNMKIFHELHADKTTDHATLTMFYFISELLDSTVSYVSHYEESK